jgi:chemotaxis protein methyltransferase CheR
MITRVKERNTKAYKLNEAAFYRLSKFVNNEYGIKLPPSKKVLLESRLQKRLRGLGMTSFSDYADYVFSSEGTKTELIGMIDTITTNKTDFFRESAHFELLLHEILPCMFSHNGQDNHKICDVWSAGCSSGEEPYTLAMVLREFAEQSPLFRFFIKATDLSSQVLEKGREGIYQEKDIEPIPLRLRRKYLLRNRDSSHPLVRIIPDLRRRVQFERLNLMDDYYSIHEMMDIIFFRNVMIYFTRETQEVTINKLCRHLKPGGYLFIGHSESLFSMKVPLVQVVPTVYRRI